jgi:hypothetical protein
MNTINGLLYFSEKYYFKKYLVTKILVGLQCKHNRSNVEGMHCPKRIWNIIDRLTGGLWLVVSLGLGCG